MKITICLYNINNYGGVINHTQALVKGFKDLGHETQLISLKNRGKTKHDIVDELDETEVWKYSEELNCLCHQMSGFKGLFEINYVEDMPLWYSSVESSDLIIFTTPVVTVRKDTLGDDRWFDIYSDKHVKAKKLAIIHDGNLRKMYPHISHFINVLDGLVCVHDSAFNSANVLPIHTKLIPNPQILHPQETPPKVVDREDVMSAIQVFKAWKHVEDPIKAFPHCVSVSKFIVAGGGIEHCYMTSKTKMKPAYIDQATGRPIWDIALENGMEFLGLIPADHRDEVLRESKLFIDPSWSRTYSKYGSHFNRTMVEAMIQGAVPVCTTMGAGNSSIVKSGVNYLEIPNGLSPEEYAEYLDEFMADTARLQTIQDHNYKFLRTFEHTNIAQQYLDFCGEIDNTIDIINHVEDDEALDKIYEASKKKLNHFETLI